MSPPALIRLEARLLVRVGNNVLLAHLPGDAWHVLPGGPVQPGENTEHALARNLGGLAELIGPARSGPGGWRFIGAAEHAGDELGNASQPRDAHTLTILFAADWPGGVPLPSTWEGHELVPVDRDLLVTTRLRPLPVAAAVRRWVMDEWPLWRGLTPGAGEVGRLGRRLSVASLKAQLAARREELRGNAFRDAAVAMCALVTAADGRVDPAERDGLRAFVASDPVMSHFPADELEALFDAHLQRLVEDPPAGRAAALAEIAKVRNRPTEAAAVIHLGEVIGRVDGEFVLSEKAAVLDAVHTLGLDPAEFAPSALPRPA
ncbi:tellurite resistance protein [Frankia sp. EI5c]|uniref:TerB family tellurite resistance protein n=1 Tax=Frankia sp. EI5c TaxID=683316 RepID=UPI0007C35ACD|nr:TerB family tellurite resistance protein [Frankia sp. EI5c]OAA23968.1 tellurite resistance protein [Frankia sp. EI5c]